MARTNQGGEAPAKRRPKGRTTSDDLQSLPSVGPNMAIELQALGFHTPAELRGQDPEQMFADLCELRNEKIDRCVLYSLRCAVYAASTDDPDPELKKWWNWKGRTLTDR